MTLLVLGSLLPTASCASRATPSLAQPSRVDVPSAPARASNRSTASSDELTAEVGSSSTTTPPVRDAAPYALDDDAAARRDHAEELFGKNLQFAAVHDIFLFAGSGSAGAARFRAALSVAEQALDALFNGRFATRPERAISVYLFVSSVPYQKYCSERWQNQCMSRYGFYLGSERTIVMDIGPGLGTLTHELVHPLVEADFPGAPEWLNEGLASLYEQFYFPAPRQISGGKNWRYPRLLQALSSKEERDRVSLPALFRLSDDDFRNDKEDLNYAVARYFCQWMDQRGKLWPFYHLFRDGRASDPTGEQAFSEVMGMPVSEANAGWLRWLRSL